MLTDGISIGMTLLNELTTLYGAEYWATKTRLRVHLVGADVNELIGLQSRVQEILHWLPHCKELELVMIFGNTGFYDRYRVEEQVEHCSLCADCKRDGVKMTLRPKRDLYHDVYSLGSLMQELPDVVMACHPGLYDLGLPGKPMDSPKTWEPTVRLLTQTDVPCIYTGYDDDETARDRAKLVEWGARIVTDKHLNPFRGLRPYPDIAADNTFYYTNHSCIVTRGHV
jgi:hypothetical protein